MTMKFKHPGIKESGRTERAGIRMALQIYNTMTRSKEQFVPQEPGKVKMYVCGPTVYGYMHIGNARPIIVFDMVRNYLEQLGNEVRYVTNFTDVDDKLIRKAEEMNTTVAEVAETFIAAYREDLEGLGVKPATLNPRVTESMELIIGFIKELEEKGYAYESGGDVYYRTSKFEDYGKLSRQNLDELQFGIRVEVDSRKENQRILCFGKQPNLVKCTGVALGETDVQAGILNARLWRASSWEIRLISMVVDKICSSHIMNANALRLKL